MRGLVRGWAVSAIAVAGLFVVLVGCGHSSSNAGRARPSSTTTASSTSAPAKTHPAKEYASSFSRADRQGDVAAVVGDNEEDLGAPAPDERRADVRSLRVVHSRDHISVTLRFFDLTLDEGKGKYNNPSYRVDVAIESTKRALSLEATLDFGLDFERAETASLHPYGGTVRCRIEHSVDQRQNAAHIQVPRACLGSPDWVRVRVYTVASIFFPFGKHAWDDALTDVPHTTSGEFRSSPRIGGLD